MTLAQTVKSFRKGTKLIFVGVFFLLIGRIILGSVGFDFNREEITPTPTPQTYYGQVDRLKLSELQLLNRENITYTLDLFSGSMTESPSTANIYPIAESELTFSAEKKAQIIARKFDLQFSPELETDTYIWEDELNLLHIHHRTFNFHYKYKNPTLTSFTPGVMFDTDSVEKIAQTIFETFQFDNVGNRLKQVTLLKMEEGQLKESGSFRNASAFRVDLIPENLPDETQLLTDKPDQSSSFVIFTSNVRNRNTYGQILELKRHEWDILTTQTSTYPIITNTQAWQQFQQNGKYLMQMRVKNSDKTANYTPLEVSEILIQEAFLAYYYPEEEPIFLQPIWCLQGIALLPNFQRADWVAYVPAIKENWIRD